MIMCSQGCVTLSSNHPAKFDGHMSCGSRYTTDIIFHAALQDHVIKGLWQFMERIFSFYIPTLLNLVATGIAVVDI